MPKIKTNRVKYPEGWELIEPTLRELDAKMRQAEMDEHDGKRKCEALWPIFKLSHQRSRYVYDLYYRRDEISKELYEFCLDQGYADRSLIAKWKKFREGLNYGPSAQWVQRSGHYALNDSRYVISVLLTLMLFSQLLMMGSLESLLSARYLTLYINSVLCEMQSGYERLCCLRCIQPRDHNYGTTCVCRVPKHLREEKVVECVHCGCQGCASGD
ncbi:hypothetical protein F2Q69_00009283 [Brassica cretica]|uniref:Uncharacterized protein n=2 Tax=Brassica cretica TaxID=69181 RepID=A0A8S9P9U8_BRACR|nr:hypothetical protein F2Q69_00009283 [Brassica cretica]